MSSAMSSAILAGKDNPGDGGDKVERKEVDETAGDTQHSEIKGDSNMEERSSNAGVEKAHVTEASYPVKPLITLDKNGRSRRNRTGVRTYNVKALAGTAIHTPRRFNQDENGQVIATVSKAARGSASMSRRSSKLGTDIQSTTVLPLSSLNTGLKTAESGQKATPSLISLAAPVSKGITFDATKLALSNTSAITPAHLKDTTMSNHSLAEPSMTSKDSEPRFGATARSLNADSKVVVDPNQKSQACSTEANYPPYPSYPSYTSYSSYPGYPPSLPTTSWIGSRAPVPIAPRLRVPAGVTGPSNQTQLSLPSFTELVTSKTSDFGTSAESKHSLLLPSVKTSEPIIQSTTVPSAPVTAPEIKNIIRNQLRRIKLVFKREPELNQKSADRTPSSEIIHLRAVTMVSKEADKGTDECTVTDESSDPGVGVSETVTAIGKTDSIGNQKHKTRNSKKRKAPTQVEDMHPFIKKSKDIAPVAQCKKVPEVVIYLHENTASSTHCTLKDEQIFRNSAVFKHILDSKADPNERYDSDDELCFDPARTKKLCTTDNGKSPHHRPSSDTRAIFIIPLLKAMLVELEDAANDKIPAFEKWDEENLAYLKDLVKSPSEKIWGLVLAWQTWIETGEVKLGRCPFQRERLLKFARVMETPVEFFRAVKIHDVDEKRFPTEHQCEMWNNGLHPEQQVDKEDEELKKYWSPYGGHIHEYYEKRGL